MKHLDKRRTVRVLVLAALALTAFALWSAQASAQTPTRPPFLLYGPGNPGDVVTVLDAEGEELGATTVAADGQWHLSVTCAAEKVPTLLFQVNGVAATPEINRTGADQAQITLALADADADEVMEDDDALMEEGDEMSEDAMSEDDDSMVEEDSEMMESDDAMAEDDDSMMDDDEMEQNGYPDSGSGGLADTTAGPSTAALAGTIALLATLVLGLGAYRLRRARHQA